jgi:predicted dehydrogenase
LDDPVAAGGGILISAGCHSLDQVLYITGAPSYEIVDRAMIFDGQIERKVSAQLTLHCKDGPVDLEYCVSWLDAQPNAIEFHFPSVVVVAGAMPEVPTVLRDGVQTCELDLASSTLPGARTSYQAFFLEWNWFLRGINEKQASPISAESAVTTARLIEDLYGRENR